MGWPLTEISGQRKDLLAANLPTVLQDPRLASDTEIPEENRRMSLAFTGAFRRSMIV